MNSKRTRAFCAAVALLLQLILSAVGYAAEPLPKGLIDIQGGGGFLSVCDGELWYDQVNPLKNFDGQKYLATYKFDTRIKVWSYTFRQEGDYLRLFLLDGEKGILPRHDGCNGWYLTADYSTDPPRVTIAKEPGKNSRWELIPMEGAALSLGGWVSARYIRNLNDAGEDAWLYWMDEGFRKIREDGQCVVMVRAPILSFDKKTIYSVSRHRVMGR